MLAAIKNGLKNKGQSVLLSMISIIIGFQFHLSKFPLNNGIQFVMVTNGTESCVRVVSFKYFSIFKISFATVRFTAARRKLQFCQTFFHDIRRESFAVGLRRKLRPRKICEEMILTT